MNVTTQKFEIDPRQRILQLEVAIEHASAAGAAVLARYSGDSFTGIGVAVEVKYPSYQFRETLRFLYPEAGLRGLWIVLRLKGSDDPHKAGKAAATVMHHYYPEEEFAVVAQGEGTTADEPTTAQLSRQ